MRFYISVVNSYSMEEIQTSDDESILLEKKEKMAILGLIFPLRWIMNIHLLVPIILIVMVLVKMDEIIAIVRKCIPGNGTEGVKLKDYLT